MNNLIHRFVAVLYLLFCLFTAMVGKTIHGSLLWAVVNFVYAPLSWIKWMLCEEVNLTIIRQSFSFFLQ